MPAAPTRDPAILSRAARIRLACFDVDGTLTDGRIHFDAAGGETKSFHVHDGLGLKRLLANHVEVAVITTRMSMIVTERMAELGVETDAAVSVALQRAHRIAFYMRRGRTPRDATELSADAHELSDDERAQVAALAVSWWDGVLTALRAREIESRGREP